MGVPTRNDVGGRETGSHGTDRRSMPMRLHYRFPGRGFKQDPGGEHPSLSRPFLLVAAGKIPRYLCFGTRLLSATSFSRGQKIRMYPRLLKTLVSLIGVNLTNKYNYIPVLLIF